MAYKEIITLLTVEVEKTRGGSATEKIVSENEIFAEERSVGLAQFTELYTIGMKATKVFKIADYLDYNDEEYLVHNGKRYNILRTFRKNEENELEIAVGSIVNKGGEDY